MEFIFSCSFRFTAKLSIECKACPYTAWNPTFKPPPHQYPAPDGAFVTIHKPTLINHYYPRAMVYLRFHSQCSILYFNMCNNL